MSNPFQFCGATGAAGASTFTLSPTAATLVGDTLALAVLTSTASNAPTAVADTQGNVWTLQDQGVTNLPNLTVFVCENSVPLALTDVITITYAGITTIHNVIGVDISNSNGTVDFDKKATATSGSPTVSTGILAVPVEAMVSFVADLNAGGAPTWTGGSTLIATQNSGTTGFLSAAFQNTTTTPAKTASATITSSTWNLITLGFPAEPVQVTSVVSSAVQGQAYSQTLTAIGGTGSYTWSIVSGSLPSGLTLSGGVIAGTPTAAAGLYNFTVQATDGVGSTATLPQSITVTVLGTVAQNTTLYANQLSAADAGQASSGLTWTALLNAGTPAVSTHNALDGTQCIAWSATANGDSAIITGSYTALPLKGYDVSGFVFSTGGSAIQVGVEFFDSGNTLIGSLVLGNAVTASGPNMWQPVQGLFTSPAGTAHIKVVAYIAACNAGDVTFLDLFYMARSQTQVLCDWVNDPMIQIPGQTNFAGNSFMDLSPWVRLVDGISLTRGRQDSISEVPSGAANFNLQNDSGTFTPFKASSLVNVSGGITTLQRRVQISETDEVGNWYTRFDGAITELDFLGDNTGNTNVITCSAADVLAPLGRADPLECWTRESVRADGPSFTWTLNDSGNTGAFGQAVESSGNNGPPMRTFDKDQNNAATIIWNDQTAGVEILADAVALTKADGSEYWSKGSNQPSSLIRGLDSGTIGPYTTPLGSIFLSPCFATQSAQNLFIGNSGFCLFTELGAENSLSPNADGEDFSLEIFFSMDATGVVQSAPLSAISGTPWTAMTAGNKIGPYIQLSLGAARGGANVVAGMYFNTTSHMTYKCALYPQPPAFSQNTWGSLFTPTQQVNTPFIPDRTPTTNGNSTVIAGGSLIHHLALVVAGAAGGGTLTCYLDGVSIGSFPLNPGQVFDTIYVGSAFGGQGAHFGNLSICSLYPYQLSASQIIDHCSKGQYGMWEQTTDNSITQLAEYANIPAYWNNLHTNNLGLSLTDYQDITGSNAITNMQLFEQCEQGLLFVNNQGQLTFHTRDWRMGYGAPDLLLPPDTYDAQMNLQLIDQFQANEAGFSSATYQSGSAFVNAESRNRYGAYTLSSSSSPTEFPFITFSRAYSLLGLPNLAQWPDPHLNDAAAWIANTRQDPWLLPGGLTVDLMATDTVAGCPKISDWYGLDIDNMIAPSGVQPNSWQDSGISTEWFIEGINETRTDTTHTLTIYTSPAEFQRAWRPGDATYGVLGSTARIGISAPDLNTVYVQAKDVSHDAGPPYVPPSFVSQVTSWSFESGTQSWTGTHATLAQSSVWSSAGAFSLKITASGSGSSWQAASAPGIPVVEGMFLTAQADVFVPQALGVVTLEINWHDASDTFISSSGGTPVSMGANSQATITAQDNAPHNALFAHVVVLDNETVVPGNIMYTDNVMCSPGPLNNPANNGHSFIGGMDLRGLWQNLSQVIEPPMLILGASFNAQTVTSGATTNPQLIWDTIYADTANGMGIIAGWPNWYVVTVPGFYEIDANVVGATVASGDSGSMQAWIVVAEEAAQGLAAGLTTPTTSLYQCPIGEQAPLNNNSDNNVAAPTTTMYLGVGDMITVAVQSNAVTKHLAFSNFGGSSLSLRWVSNSVYADACQSNSLISSGGTISGVSPFPPVSPTGTKTYKNTHTYSYYGSSAESPNRKRTSDGLVYQGTYSGGGHVDGSQYGQVQFDFAQMITDIYNGGAFTITSATLTCTNEHTWYNSGGKLMVGSCFDTPGGATWVPGTNPLNIRDVTTISFAELQTKTFAIPVSLINSFLASGDGHSPSMRAFFIGNNATEELTYYGYWKGGPSTWTLTVNYTNP